MFTYLVQHGWLPTDDFSEHAEEIKAPNRESAAEIFAAAHGLDDGSLVAVQNRKGGVNVYAIDFTTGKARALPAEVA